MLKVFVKGLNQRGYVCGFAFQPVMRETMVPTNLGDMKGIPDLGGVQFKKVQQQVLVPVVFVVTEEGQMGLVAVDGLVPLLSEQELKELRESEVPEEALEEAQKIAASQQPQEGKGE